MNLESHHREGGGDCEIVLPAITSTDKIGILHEYKRTFTCEPSCDKASLYALIACSYSRFVVASSAMSQHILKLLNMK